MNEEAAMSEGDRPLPDPIGNPDSVELFGGHSDDPRRDQGEDDLRLLKRLEERSEEETP